MKYCKSYCEEKRIGTSKLNKAQRTLYYMAENMKMNKSISEEGYKHFQMAIKALAFVDKMHQLRTDYNDYKISQDERIKAEADLFKEMGI